MADAICECELRKTERYIWGPNKKEKRPPKVAA